VTAQPTFCTIPEALEELRAARMIVLTDDESRENEGDLVLPAQFVTPEAITFMLSVARGYLCLALPESDCDRLDLHPQASVNTTVRGTAFTVSIDLHPRHGGTTGVSARERARCVQMAIDPRFGPADFVRPGHINPLRSRDGGVLVRTGQTEGSVDLCRLAGLTPGALIIEVMRDDGEMARLPDLVELCRRHNLKMCSVNQIIEHRLARESLVRRAEPLAGAPLVTPAGTFTLRIFDSLVDPLPHLALTMGDVGELDALGRPIETDEPTLVRMHRRNLLGDVFGAAAPGSPTSHGQLMASMHAVARAGRGAIVYLRPEGHATPDSPLEARLQTIRRGPLDAAALKGADAPDLAHPLGHGGAIPPTMRQFGIGGQILRHLGLRKLRLLTNHKAAMPGLEAFGLSVVEHVPIEW
jgi:3,4-dihydroxy 2-butanone 4-phosphate synthase/GTP cyclohydrolase II